MISREMMLNKVIEKFGFEDERTIYFARLCEELGDTVNADILIEVHFEKLMNEKVSEEDE